MFTFDKWRNMNVGLGGGSREKTPKSSTKHGVAKGADESVAGEFSTEENVDTDSSKDRKLLDSRYTEMIVNALSEMNETNGSTTTAVAAFIEARHPVPSNFRRMLSSKLRDMVAQGNVCKVKQNYKVNTEGALQARDENEAYKNNINLESHSKSQPKGGTIARYDAESAKMKCKSVYEAARLAALAVAEAEVAAAAAERAAKEAEAAQAEAEAAEIAAELALLAARPSKKVCGSSIRLEDKGIAV